MSLEEPHHQVVIFSRLFSIGHTEHPAKNPNWNPKHQAQSSSSRRSHHSTIHSHRLLRSVVGLIEIVSHRAPHRRSLTPKELLIPKRLQGLCDHIELQAPFVEAKMSLLSSGLNPAACRSRNHVAPKDETVRQLNSLMSEVSKPGGTVEPGTPTERKLAARGGCLVGDIPVPSPPAAAEVDLVGEEVAAAAPVGLDGDVGAASGSGSSVASCHQSCQSSRGSSSAKSKFFSCCWTPCLSS